MKPSSVKLAVVKIVGGFFIAGSLWSTLAMVIVMIDAQLLDGVTPMLIYSLLAVLWSLAGTIPGFAWLAYQNSPSVRREAFRAGAISLAIVLGINFLIFLGASSLLVGPEADSRTMSLTMVYAAAGGGLGFMVFGLTGTLIGKHIRVRKEHDSASDPVGHVDSVG